MKVLQELSDIIKKRKKFYIIALILILIIGVTMGYSFSYFFATDVIENNLVNTECFKISFEDRNDIYLDNAYPMSDSEASQLTPYTFTIKNTCKITANYQVNIETMTGTSLDRSYLKYELDNDEPKLLSSASLVDEKLNMTAIESRKLVEGMIVEDEEITYNLRLWIDETTTKEQTANKLYKGKVVIISTNNKDKYNKVTLNANGGEVNPDFIKIKSGNEIGTIPTPTRNGYTFIGWYTQENGGQEVTSSTVINENKEIFAHWYLIENAVVKINNLGPTTDQLLNDGTSDNNLRYVGKTPNNYVQFNGELWRIIGVMNNIQTSGGYTKSLLKIRRAESLGNYSWDTTSSSDSNANNGSGINQWGLSGFYEGADLMRELNYDYLGDIRVATDGKWFNGSNNLKSADKPSTTISSDAQNIIETVVWNLGSPSNNNGVHDTNYSSGTPAPVTYVRERANTNGKVCTGGSYCTDTVTRTSTWTGKVALIYPSDYLYATAGGTTTSRSTCLEQPMYNLDQDCKDNNWLKPRNSEWTLTPHANANLSVANYVYYISFSSVYITSTCSNNNVVPVVFLKSSTNIIKGDGSQSNPYVVSL